MKKKKHARQVLSEQEEALQQEIKKLNYLAEEALRQGRSLAEDEHLLRQSRQTDEMILSIQQLQSMLEEYDREKGSQTGK